MSFQLDWNRLLSKQRPGGNGVGHAGASTDTKTNAGAGGGMGDRSEFEQDYDRVIFSAPFRRLAGKTQVHPFAQIDHVHNRLTHTLEVASVGRSLAAKAARFLKGRGELSAEVDATDIGFIVQAACLAHDMGNPPFGHAGEYAFRAWAREHLGRILKEQKVDASGLAAVVGDWRWFEGNAQSFRLVSRSDRNERDYFRFTYASLGAMIKYPWTSGDSRTEEEEKHNAFSSEAGVFFETADALGLRMPDGRVARHPLSFLSEAADDICYRISDLEDAVEMGILPDAEVRNVFAKIAGDVLAGRPMSALRAKVIGQLIDQMARVFEADYAAIMTGARTKDLKSSLPGEVREAMQEIKDLYERIFAHRRKVAVELGAHSILARILDGHVRAVGELAALGGDYGKLGFVHKRTLELAWEKEFISKNKTRCLGWWLGRVMDHVAGMTDAYATQVAREIAGG